MDNLTNDEFGVNKDFLIEESKKAVQFAGEESWTTDRVIASLRKKYPYDAKINKEMMERAKAGDKEALEKILVNNSGLVLYFASKCSSASIRPEDLYQEGMLGVMKAVERFNPELGFAFSTYASQWIMQHMFRYIQNMGNAIRIPVYALEINMKLLKLEKDIQDGVYPEMTLEEKARHLEIQMGQRVTEDKIRQMLAVIYVDSLDREFGEDSEDSTTMMDYLKAPEQYEVENIYERNELAELCNKALDSLTEIEKEVIIRRFGLNDQCQETLDAIAKTKGVSRERIRQIELRALKKLKRVKHKYFCGYENYT